MRGSINNYIILLSIRQYKLSVLTRRFLGGDVPGASPKEKFPDSQVSYGTIGTYSCGYIWNIPYYLFKTELM